MTKKRENRIYHLATDIETPDLDCVCLFHGYQMLHGSKEQLDHDGALARLPYLYTSGVTLRLVRQGKNVDSVDSCEPVIKGLQPGGRLSALIAPRDFFDYDGLRSYKHPGDGSWSAGKTYQRREKWLFREM